MRTPILVLVLVIAGGCGKSTVRPLDGGGAPDAADPGPVDGGLPIVDGGFDAAPEVDAGQVCGPDERLTTRIFYGTREPTTMPLSAGQVLAIVDFEDCSGSFITDEWVLTANHCGVTVGRTLCVGPEPAHADVCFTVDRVENKSGVDLTLVHVDVPATSRIAELEPIPIMTETIDGSWVGRTAEASGYGTQEDDSIGEREFTAEPIADVTATEITIDGGGTHGVCFGDSGGPLMVLATDSTVRVAGALSYGDPSCVGLDTFTRTDVETSWIEAVVGPVAVPGTPCRSVGSAGDCVGARTAVWCDGVTLASETCDAGESCGWSEGDGGYRCVAVDPCGGLRAAGECRDGMATWCDRGALRHRDCTACGQLCAFVAEVSAFDCAPDPCAGMDPAGMCDGDVLTTCDEDGVHTRDCTTRRRRCAFDEGRGVYRCVR